MLIAIDHQVLSHQPAGIREPLGESSGAGKKQQARRLRAVGAHNHRAGFLEMLPAPVIKIGDTRGAAMAIGLHPESVTLRADFAAAGLLRHGNDARQRAGLRSHLAAETQAAPAMDAPRPAPVRLGKNRHGARGRDASRASRRRAQR